MTQHPKTIFHQENEGGVSAPADTVDPMDQMIQRASTPSLASLFKQGKARGLLSGTTMYGS